MNVDRLPDRPDDPALASDTAHLPDSPPPENAARRDSEPERHAPDQQPDRRPSPEQQTHQDREPERDHPPEPPQSDPADPAEPRSRQEHAEEFAPRDEPRPCTPQSADQRDLGQADPRSHEESLLAAQGDSPETDDLPPRGDARMETHEVSKRQEQPTNEAGINPEAAAEYGNPPTEDPPNDQPDPQSAQESDKAHDPVAPPDDPNMPITATTEKEAPKPDNARPTDDLTHSLTDREWAEHITEVRDGLRKAYEQKLNTDCAYTINGAGEVWLEERERLHDAIIEDLYKKAADVPCDFKAIVAGGLGGAGKTTVLTEHAVIDLSQYLMINPDNMKEEMARRGMIPEVDGLSPMEASELAHEESSYLANQLALRAQADGKNLIWDITMSREESTVRRISELDSTGYTRIDGLFVQIPVVTSLRRIESRHREGHDKYRAEIGLGGRYVPPEVTKSQEDKEWGSKNMKTFNSVKHRFSDWSIYDNSVDWRQPILVQASRNRHVGE